jgi:hypothetical protein
MNALAPALLGMEAIVALLVIPAAARGQSHVALRIALAAALALVLILAASRAHRRSGRMLGSLLQPVLIVSGLLAWPMWILGVMFAGLWVAMLRTMRTYASG